MRCRLLGVLLLAALCGCATVERTDEDIRGLIIAVKSAEAPAEVGEEPAFAVEAYLTFAGRTRTRSLFWRQETTTFGARHFPPLTGRRGEELVGSVQAESDGRRLLIQPASGEPIVGQVIEAGMILRLTIDAFDPSTAQGTMTVECASQSGGELQFYVFEEGVAFRLDEPVVLR